MSSIPNYVLSYYKKGNGQKLIINFGSCDLPDFIINFYHWANNKNIKSKIPFIVCRVGIAFKKSGYRNVCINNKKDLISIIQRTAKDNWYDYTKYWWLVKALIIAYYSSFTHRASPAVLYARIGFHCKFIPCGTIKKRECI